jgi:uncharacterized membrane protein YhiD involved in acid resistance
VINVLLRPVVIRVNRLAARYGGGLAMTYQIEFTCRAENVNEVKQALLQNLDRQHLALRALQAQDGEGGRQLVSAEIIAYGPDDQRIETLVAGLSAPDCVNSARWSILTSAGSDARLHPGS